LLGRRRGVLSCRCRPAWAFPNGARFIKKGIFFAPKFACDVDFLLSGSIHELILCIDPDHVLNFVHQLDLLADLIVIQGSLRNPICVMFEL
jgi:hypothetical protein